MAFFDISTVLVRWTASRTRLWPLDIAANVGARLWATLHRRRLSPPGSDAI
jgi:hypothetical protein